MGAESLNLRRIAVIASGRDNKHISLRELNPVKVGNSKLTLPLGSPPRYPRAPPTYAEGRIAQKCFC